MTAGLGSRLSTPVPRLFLTEFTGPGKTPSSVLPEERRVSRFIPKNGPRKTRNHFQTLTVPKTIRAASTTCLSPKNHSVINDSIKLPALTAPPLQFPRLAQGLLCVICSTHYAARDFAKKTQFLLSFLNIFPIHLSNAPCLLLLSPRPCPKLS